MAEILRTTNPVPGYENNNINRNLPQSPNDTSIQNIVDPTRVGRADGRTDQQNGSATDDAGLIRYDSNFQSFVQDLRESPDLAQSLSKLIALKEGTVVLSGLSEGMAEEITKALESMRMSEGELMNFLSGQFKAGTRFGGALFALLRGAYNRSGSDVVRNDILQFLKSYSDYSSTGHIEGNILRNVSGMARNMPESWSVHMREFLSQLENGVAAGDRKGNIQILQKGVFPYMAQYVERTHDMGRARMLLTLLSLDIARYENGSEDKLLESFHRMSSYGTLKDQLGGIDSQSLMALLKSSAFSAKTAANQFADRMANAAAMALRGEGSAETQDIFRQLVSAMLINESVYMPVNHFILPVEMDDRMMFSELWVDPDSEDEDGSSGSSQGGVQKFLLKMDVQSLGLFDVVMLSHGEEVNISISCPEKVAPFSKMIAEDVSGILTRNGLTPSGVSVRKMEVPVSLTEVFPKIFERKNSVNVKA